MKGKEYEAAEEVTYKHLRYQFIGFNVQREVIKCFIASRVTKPEENNQ